MQCIEYIKIIFKNVNKIITKQIEVDYIKIVQSDPQLFFELSFLQMSVRVACK